MSQGILYVVATPIGNMGDMSFRAVETLKTVDLILSEDTRQTDKILKQFNITKRQIPYTDQKHESIKDYVAQTLNEGKNVALVSDNGTPLISDPGYKLISYLNANNFKVESIPGPSAIISAISISGLPTDKFVFLGFPPKNNAQRAKLITEYGRLDATLTFYESPYRVVRLLEDLLRILGNRTVFIAKDLTKHYEETYLTTLEDILKNGHLIKPKGEYVVLVAKEDFYLEISAQ